jgi:hypothetical protein
MQVGVLENYDRVTTLLSSGSARDMHVLPEFHGNMKAIPQQAGFSAYSGDMGPSAGSYYQEMESKHGAFLYATLRSDSSFTL